MSYCRISGDSDVYAFPSVDGKYVCCACSLLSDTWASYEVATPQELLAHLEEHRASGDLVPCYALERLQQEIEKEDS